MNTTKQHSRVTRDVPETIKIDHKTFRVETQSLSGRSSHVLSWPGKSRFAEVPWKNITDGTLRDHNTVIEKSSFYLIA